MTGRWQVRYPSAWFFVVLLIAQSQHLLNARAQDTSSRPINHLAANPPRLIVQIVVDQLRGDMLTRYHDRFEAGGFRLLMDQGLWYTDAHHPQAATQTAVGHATLATGAFPSRHGIVANNWYDPKTHAFREAVADPSTSVVGDPSKKGSSPVSLMTTTFSDELTISTDHRSKIFAVSVKDRGAIPLAGHTGKAYWFSDTSGRFVTSTYYEKSYPAWVNRWNEQDRSGSWAGKTWAPLRDLSTYLYVDQPPYAPNLFDYGSSFPHPFGVNNAKDAYYPKLMVSYVGDELTLDFAEALIDKELLGRNSVPDYLGISFSSNDLVGHFFTDTSPEAEDVLLRLDHDLALLFEFIDKQPGLGLQNTLIVLSGDHGIAEVPAYLQHLGVPTGTVDQKAFLAKINDSLRTRYKRGDLLAGYSTPYLYLDHSLIAAAGLQLEEVVQTAAKAAMSVDGVYLAQPTSQLAETSLTDAALIERIQRNQYPARSGDIYVVEYPQWQMGGAATGGEISIVDHGSPWDYDSFVPVLFGGMALPAERISRPIATTDIAATLAGRVGTKLPSGNSGVELPEVTATQPAPQR